MKDYYYYYYDQKIHRHAYNYRLCTGVSSSFGVLPKFMLFAIIYFLIFNFYYYYKPADYITKYKTKGCS